MNDIREIIAQIDLLTERTEDIARDIRMLSNNMRRFIADNQLD